jgi:hypothetical protein
LPRPDHGTTGVLRTTTHIAFKSYSRAEVEAGFSIGE